MGASVAQETVPGNNGIVQLGEVDVVNHWTILMESLF